MNPDFSEFVSLHGISQSDFCSQATRTETPCSKVGFRLTLAAATSLTWLLFQALSEDFPDSTDRRIPFAAASTTLQEGTQTFRRLLNRPPLTNHHASVGLELDVYLSNLH